MATEEAADPACDYFVGLDLGQSSDPTALAVLRRRPILDEAGAVRRNHRGKRLFAYACPHLERYPLGTPYPEIVQRVKRLLERPELGPRPYLAIDATGVGRAVVDVILGADLPAESHPITITGGAGEPRKDAWNGSPTQGYWVPKLDLVGSVQAALSSERLKFARSLPLAETLKKELLHFKVKVTLAANEVFGAWREGQHDDLVLAVALAVWLGDEEDYRPYVGIAGAVAVPVVRRNLVLGGCQPRGCDDAMDRWNRTGAYGESTGPASNYGFAEFRRPRRNFYGR